MGFIDGLAVPAAITVVCTVIAAVTLLPALFGVLGLRVLSLEARSADAAARRRAVRRGQRQRQVGALVAHRAAVPRGALAAAGLALMIVVSAPVLHLRLGFADDSNDPTSSTTYQAYEMLAAGFGPGFNGPLLLVGQGRSSPADLAALGRLDRAVAGVTGVAAVQGGPARTGLGHRACGAGDTGTPEHRRRKIRPPRP